MKAGIYKLTENDQGAVEELMDFECLSVLSSSPDQVASVKDPGYPGSLDILFIILSDSDKPIISACDIPAKFVLVKFQSYKLPCLDDFRGKFNSKCIIIQAYFTNFILLSEEPESFVSSCNFAQLAYLTSFLNDTREINLTLMEKLFEKNTELVPEYSNIINEQKICEINKCQNIIAVLRNIAIYKMINFPFTISDTPPKPLPLSKGTFIKIPAMNIDKNVASELDLINVLTFSTVKRNITAERIAYNFVVFNHPPVYL